MCFLRCFSVYTAELMLCTWMYPLKTRILRVFRVMRFLGPGCRHLSKTDSQISIQKRPFWHVKTCQKHIFYVRDTHFVTFCRFYTFLDLRYFLISLSQSDTLTIPLWEHLKTTRWKHDLRPLCVFFVCTYLYGIHTGHVHMCDISGPLKNLKKHVKNMKNACFSRFETCLTVLAIFHIPEALCQIRPCATRFKNTCFCMFLLFFRYF